MGFLRKGLRALRGMLREVAEVWSFGREIQRQYGIGAIEKRVNLYLVVAAFLATAAAFLATAAAILLYFERAHRSWTAAYGVEAIATIEEAISSSPGHWYALKLAWTDASGATQRVENVLVTKQFAAKIVALPDIDPEKGGPAEVTRRELPIKYLAWAPNIPLVVEDAARSEMFGTAVWVATAAAPLLILLTVALIRLTDANPAWHAAQPPRLRAALTTTGRAPSTKRRPDKR